MPTGPFDSSNFAAIAAPPIPTSLQMSSLAVRIARPGTFGEVSASREVEWPVDAIVDRGALGKGVRWALGIEGVAALLIYALWHLWSIIR